MWDPDGRISGVHDDPVCFGAGGIRGTADLALDDDYPDSTNRKPGGRSNLAMPASDARSPSRSREATRVEIDAEGDFPDTGRTSNVWTRVAQAQQANPWHNPSAQAFYLRWVGNRGTLEWPAGWCHSVAPAFS